MDCTTGRAHLKQSWHNPKLSLCGSCRWGGRRFRCAGYGWIQLGLSVRGTEKVLAVEASSFFQKFPKIQHIQACARQRDSSTPPQSAECNQLLVGYQAPRPKVNYTKKKGSVPILCSTCHPDTLYAAARVGCCLLAWVELPCMQHP